ncbi:hypothetical protein F0562_013951 [Nyssa sinensis]|uniref:Uncharacterized protein n=1 Tax=Nyssa sinensis TaxID=561372 RepID=A0A5J4ZP29_9ASTE|nr:hypothetical protein F0562_013951 [Nyssa sinensis]
MNPNHKSGGRNFVCESRLRTVGSRRGLVNRPVDRFDSFHEKCSSSSRLIKWGGDREAFPDSSATSVWCRCFSEGTVDPLGIDLSLVDLLVVLGSC